MKDKKNLYLILIIIILPKHVPHVIWSVKKSIKE